VSSPSLAQVREQAVTVRQRVKDARIIGIRADAWSGPDSIELDRVPFRVAFCESPLHVREELLDLKEDAGLIVLTPASEEALGSDVMLRLAKRQIFDIDTWRIALDLFKARVVDPRVQRARWLADALVESAPPGGYEPVPASVLDADTVWDALLRHRVGLPDGRPDAVTLLRWASTAAEASRYTSLPAEFRQAVRARARETAGVVGETMLDALEAMPNADLVSLGLACRVLFHPEAGGELRDAAIRFERFHRHHPLPVDVALQWAEAAERVIAERESADGWPAVRPRADKSDRLLTELGAGTSLHLGRWSPGGFEQRLGKMAGAIIEALGQSAGVRAVESAAASVLDHRLARVYLARQRRVEMARRLVRWLQSPSASSHSLVDAVQAYCQQGAFVDLARLVLLGGEQPAELGSAYVALLARVRERREQENELFGRLVASSAAQPPDGASPVPVELVLDNVVAPLARAVPVFMLVMDGLSRAVYQDLLQSMGDAGWQCWEPQKDDSESRRWAAFAALPSITEISRTSLFAGRVIAGDASTETREFSAHAALQQVSRSRKPPVLFHKGMLLGPSGRGLSDEVRTALLDGEQRIVAAVVNVVDDLLFKGDQIHPRWDLDAAPVVKELLDAARVAGRAVVLTSDHGHLLDDDTAFQGREAGDRWREDTSAAAEGEVRVEGRRVLAKGRSSLVVPWSERTRYSGKKNGYHGGVSPQEMVLPLAVLTWGENALEGFREVVNVYPSWWFEASAVPAAQPRPARSTAGVKPGKPTPTMFDLLETEKPTAASSWLDRLFTSPVLLEQKALSQGRGIPSDDEVRRLLLALTERGGRITRVALAQRMGVPPFRLAGLVAATRRLLNVDGLQVLDIDDASDTVILNRPLLEQQFEVDVR
jgi:hypothetical protein